MAILRLYIRILLFKIIFQFPFLLFKNINQSNLNFEFNSENDIYKASASRDSNGVKAKKDDFNLYALIPTLGTIDVGGLELGLVGAITSSKLLNAHKSDETTCYTEGNGIGILNKDDEFIRRNYLALANSKSIDAEISLFGLSY